MLTPLGSHQRAPGTQKAQKAQKHRKLGKPARTRALAWDPTKGPREPKKQNKPRKPNKNQNICNNPESILLNFAKLQGLHILNFVKLQGLHILKFSPTAGMHAFESYKTNARIANL